MTINNTHLNSMASSQSYPHDEDSLSSNEMVVQLPMMAIAQNGTSSGAQGVMNNTQFKVYKSSMSAISDSDFDQPPTNSNLVQVSTTTLYALTRSMEELQQRLKGTEERQLLSDLQHLTLTRENAALKSELAGLRSDLGWLATCSDKFILFPKLPIELRLKIWGFALAAPQIIGMGKTKKDGYRYIIPTNRHSPLLRVNCEARAEAWNVQQSYYIPPAYTPRININLAIDTLWISTFSRSLLHFSDPTDSKHEIRRLALNYSFFESRINMVVTFEQLFDFPNLEEIYIVYSGENCTENSDVQFIEPRESPVCVMKDPDRIRLLETLIAGYGWKDLGILDSVGLKIWKKDHQRFRKERLEAGKDAGELRDLSNWNPPKVYFKEAINRGEIRPSR